MATLEYPQRSDSPRPPLSTYVVGNNDGTFSAVLDNPLNPREDFPIDLDVVVRCGIEFGPHPFTVTGNATSLKPRILTSPGSGACGWHADGQPILCRQHVKAFTPTGAMNNYSFNIYAHSYRGGASIAAADIDGDGEFDAIAGSGPNAEESVVAIRSSSDNFINNVGAFGPFKGGVNVAAGDLTGDGKAEIVEGARAGGGPHVQVITPGDPNPRASFYAYDAGFPGGVSVAVADVLGDSRKEIITGAGPGGGPHVRIFNGRGQVLAEFFAFAPSFRGGVNVAAGDTLLGGVTLTNKAEIVVTPASAGPPVVRTFTGRGLLLGSFLAYAKTYRGGVTVAVGNADDQPGSEIVTGVAGSAPPLVRTFTPTGEQLPGASFYAYEKYPSGVNVAVG